MKTEYNISSYIEAAEKRQIKNNQRLTDIVSRCIDHTTLSATDSVRSVREFVDRAMASQIIPATICVYPSMIESVGIALGDSLIGITAVCGAFPAGQTYLEVKLLEVAMAIENGADEIDLVMNIGEAMDGNMNMVAAEIEAVKNEIADEAVLKVILEVGALVDPELIYKSSMVVMEAGADFIKTSTGKTPIGATPSAVALMCCAARDYFKLSQRKVGIKCAGGVSTMKEAVLYAAIVQEILGEQWMNPALFRIGSSKIL